MTERFRSQMKNPWAWFATLLVVGVILSIVATSSGTIVRVADAAPLNPTQACIPLLERLSDGKLTGKMSCATDEQVKQICEHFTKDEKDKK
jgi:hypothetical protein